MFTLIVPFFIIALLYSTVGFGGGTSYTALLALVGVPFFLIPKISLICNILVVSGGSYQYFRKGHFRRELISTLIMSSIPMAFLGGSFPLSEKTFFLVLSLALLLCGIRILFLPDREVDQVKLPHVSILLAIGGFLGLLSGMVGIGGGILLSPLLINLGWARAKEAAALSSLFILVNSLSGLMGQLTKSFSPEVFLSYFPLFIVVIVGGQIGSRIGTNSKVSNSWVQKGTGLLTLLISARLLAGLL